MADDRILRALAFNVNRIMEEQGLKSRDVYENTSLSKGYLSNIRNARQNVSLYKVAELANYLGVPYYQLLLEEKKPGKD